MLFFQGCKKCLYEEIMVFYYVSVKPVLSHFSLSETNIFSIVITNKCHNFANPGCFVVLLEVTSTCCLYRTVECLVCRHPHGGGHLQEPVPPGAAPGQPTSQVQDVRIPHHLLQGPQYQRRANILPPQNSWYVCTGKSFL